MVTTNKRKISKARQRLLDERHKRDCSAWRNLELSCTTCEDIHRREMEEDARECIGGKAHDQGGVRRVEG